jgi:hypothetical protein
MFVLERSLGSFQVVTANIHCLNSYLLYQDTKQGIQNILANYQPQPTGIFDVVQVVQVVVLAEPAPGKSFHAAPAPALGQLCNKPKFLKRTHVNINVLFYFLMVFE